MAGDNPHTFKDFSELINFVKTEYTRVDQINELLEFVATENSKLEFPADSEQLIKASEALTAKIREVDPLNDYDSYDYNGGCYLIHKEYDGLYTPGLKKRKGDDGKEYWVLEKIYLHFDKIAARVIKELNVISYKGLLWIYRNGCYQKSEEFVISEITRIINRIKRDVFSTGIKASVENILHNVRFSYPMSEYPFNRETAAIPVKNGIVLLDFENKTRRLIPHSPEYMFNYCIQTDYDENADPASIDNILREYAPEQVKELYQFPAQAILQMLGYGPFKKSYLFQGEKDSGKTTYVDLLHLVFGIENCSDVSLELLNPKVNKFALSSLEGKLLNIHDDMTYFSIKDTGTFKMITGGFIVEIEPKGKPRYIVDLRAAHGFTCNRTPKYDKEVKKDAAFWERWIFVNFPNHFKKDLQFKQEHFTPGNISGFLNKVLDLVLEIGHEKKLSCNYTYAEIRDKWAKCSDPVYRFVSGNMDPIEAHERPMYFIKEDFLTLLKYWADDMGEEEDIPATVDALSKNIEICRIDNDAKVTNEAGIRKYVYGIPYKWKANSNYNPDKNEDIQNKGVKEVIPVRKQAKFTDDDN